jgi:hypothetical protein
MDALGAHGEGELAGEGVGPTLDQARERAAPDLPNAESERARVADEFGLAPSDVAAAVLRGREAEPAPGVDSLQEQASVVVVEVGDDPLRARA